MVDNNRVNWLKSMIKLGIMNRDSLNQDNPYYQLRYDSWCTWIGVYKTEIHELLGRNSLMRWK